MGKACSAVGGYDNHIGIFVFGGLDYFLSRRSHFYKGLGLNR